MGSMMLGGLSIGALADYIGVLNTLRVQAVFCALIAVVYAKNLKHFDVKELDHKVTREVQKI